MKIEHIGIAVRSLEVSIPLYSRLLGVPCYKTEEVGSEGVITAFFAAGEGKVELLEDNGASGVISRYIDKKGEGIHHIAFAVTDIWAEMARLKAEGFELLQDEPKRGADNKLVCFVHPKSANGVLVELCQDAGELMGS
ncbi:methylmalonyl-CoA epimerase [Flavihumibacter petaseus]|uniref:Putative methylmalonyl-CoA epimerase n=1 Tax=Flavihumibacter petaseus NBRC 106054 TaxID=1220578 RepID=A0A0E9MW67_9BACT|nr:methylmalonyl-CoA epimerase [Flavihumibacter petaseus]GAO41671.1 putative methylmalonyl-CoA epimerase [Flavihumibacter petaseus NBRC 106054]